MKDKVLIAGKWIHPNRVRFNTLLALTDASMNAGLAEGVTSWDTYISRQLSIVLISSLASRSGDVARTRAYTGQEMERPPPYGPLYQRELETWKGVDGRGVLVEKVGELR